MNKQTHFSPRSLTRSLTALFGGKKRLSPQKRYPDEYYMQIILPRNLSNGIKWLAKTRRITIKQQAEELLEKAFSDKMNELVDQAADEMLIENYVEKNRDIIRFIMAFRKLAKEKGVNVDQFVPPIQTRPKKPKQ